MSNGKNSKIFNEYKIVEFISTFLYNKSGDNMKKKGFTLVEVITIIVIISVLSLLIVPRVTTIIRGSKDKTYDSVIETIKDSAKSYTYLNTLAVDNGISSDEYYDVPLITLQQMGLLDIDLVNPKTDAPLGPYSVVRITKDGENYVFTYLEDTYLTKLVTLIVNLNGGSTTQVFSNEYPNGTEMTLLHPSKIGHSFTKWTLTGEGSSITDDLLYIGTNTTEIMANYMANNYVVTFNANGGSTPSMGTKTVTYLETYGDLPTATKIGYTFAGWAGKNKFNSSLPNQTLYNLTYTNGTYNQVAADTSAQLQWKIQKFNGDTYVGTIANKDQESGRISFTFTKDSTFTDICFGLNGTAKDTKTKINVSHLENGKTYTISANILDNTQGSVSWNNVQIEEGSALTPYEPYYISSSTKVTTPKDHTLTAGWTTNKYTVTFDPNGGSVGTSSKQVTYDGTYGALPTPTRAGYTFAGWYTSSSGGTKIDSTTKVSITDAQTLYAHWNLVTYTISYTLNGGTVSGNPTTYNVTTETITLKNPTKTDYIFTGWTGSNGSTAQTTVTIPKGSTGNKTYTANFTPNQVTVTVNGAVNETITVKSGSTTVATITTNSSAKATLTIKPGTYTFTSNLAKSTSSVGSYYSKSITISTNTTTVNFYPDGAVYWFGNGNYSGQSLYDKFGGIGGGNVNTVDTSDHWHAETNSFYASVTSGSSTIYQVYANSKKAFSTTKADGSKYTKIKSISTAAGNFSDGCYNSSKKWCYHHSKSYMAYSSSSPSSIVSEVGVTSTSQAIYSINISSSYSSIYYYIRAEGGACCYSRSTGTTRTYAVWME